MLYQITHQTTYSYSQPVHLKPHLLRLCPRCDRFQQLHEYSWSVLPLCQGSSEFIDLDGNNLTKLWFIQPTQQLTLQTKAKVETNCINPFAFMLESWAVSLPFDYPSSLLQQLEPYLKSGDFCTDSSIVELSRELLMISHGNTLDFLFALNQRIYQDCKYSIRDEGNPLPPGITWREKKGTCRDYAVLFMEVCRAMGIAARFVSGYQEGDKNQQSRDLHAWAEAYLPGAGWRGYDPTLGMVVSDRHIPLAASPIPSYTAPVLGMVTPVKPGMIINSRLQAQITIQSV